MEEQTNAVVETPVEATPVVEETNEVSQTEPEATQEEVNSEVANNSPEEPQKESDSHRPTRTERRIQQLASKVREMSETKPQVNNDVFGNQLPPWWQTNQQTEANDGELTIEQLNNKIMTVTQLAIAKDRQEQGFKQILLSHSSELGEIMDSPEFGDKDFERRYLNFYEKVNGNAEAFRPKMSPKELFNELKGVIKLGESNGQAEAANSMARTIANAAVTPTSSRPDTNADESRQRLLKAKQTGTTDDWAAALKDML